MCLYVVEVDKIFYWFNRCWINLFVSMKRSAFRCRFQGIMYSRKLSVCANFDCVPRESIG